MTAGLLGVHFSASSSGGRMASSAFSCGAAAWVKIDVLVAVIWE